MIPMISVCGSIFGSYPRLIFTQQNIVVVERSQFISDGIKKIGFIPKKSNYKPKTLHHRRHGRDNKEKSWKTKKSK